MARLAIQDAAALSSRSSPLELSCLRAMASLSELLAAVPVVPGLLPSVFEMLAWPGALVLAQVLAVEPG